MHICVCCQQYRVEEVVLDWLDGRGERMFLRLLYRGYKIDDYGDVDDLRGELDARGILMWPGDDGCE